jgi:hypothetical protein
MGRHHTAGNVAARAGADEADTESGAVEAAVMVVMMAMPAPAMGGSGGRSEYGGAERRCGDSCESKFAKHGRSPGVMRDALVAGSL